MTKGEKRELQELVLQKTVMALTAITSVSNPEVDKDAAEAARALTNAMMNIQMMKTESDER